MSTRAVECDVCIIGSGISAAMVAERLVRDGRRNIVVLEAGAEQPGPLEFARLRQRKCKQRIACLAMQAACRLFFALRRARLRRAQLNAMPLVAEEAVISLEMRRTSALEQLADLMERLKESDTDGMAMTTLQGERVTAIRDCDCH